MSEFSDRIDALTIDDLVAAGSLKWTAHPDAIGAWVAEMDFGLAPEVVSAISGLLARQQTGYAPMAMRREIKQATAEFVAHRYGWQVPQDNVHWLPDVLTGLGVTMTHLAAQRQRIIVPTPCYMPFVDMPATFGRELVQLPMLRTPDAWELDLERLEKELAAGPALLVLCNPHNPIGKVYSEAELTRICELVTRHDALVFSDEIHAPLTYPGAQHLCYAGLNEVAAAHTVTAMSASKSFNTAGLKCAQLITTNAGHQRWMTSQGHGLPYEPTPLGIVANIAAFREGADWLSQVVDYLDGNRRLVIDQIAERMPQVRMIAPEATFLAWLDCRELGLEDPRGHFLSAGVALTDGADCGDAGRGHVRLNFAMPRPILVEALDRMARSLT